MILQPIASHWAPQVLTIPRNGSAWSQSDTAGISAVCFTEMNIKLLYITVFIRQNTSTEFQLIWVFYSSVLPFNLPEGITSYKQGALHSTKLEKMLYWIVKENHLPSLDRYHWDYGKTCTRRFICKSSNLVWMLPLTKDSKCEPYMLLPCFISVQFHWSQWGLAHGLL